MAPQDAGPFGETAENAEKRWRKNTASLINGLDADFVAHQLADLSDRVDWLVAAGQDEVRGHAMTPD
jgi:hypothetical protein